MIKKLVYISCLFLLIWQAGMAQEFLYQAQLDTVPADGFYKINISPRISGYAKPDLADVRLYTPSLEEVPYILQREEPVQYTKLFREYEMVSKISKPASGTTLILRNPARSKINNISLIIQNTNASKKAQLSGSNNATDWYSIDDHFMIQPVKNQLATSEVKALSFPLNDYEYYKLYINDSLSAPLNILKAGYYDTYTESGKYTEIEGLQMVQRDSTAIKQTFVHVQLKQPVYVDKLLLDIASPSYYKRQLEIKTVRITTDKRKREKVEHTRVASAILNSSSDNTIFPDQFYAKDFYLLIYNEDNAPLQIKGVRAYQLNTYLIASLKKGETYQLKFGQPDLNAPQYDLAYFKDKFPPDIPILQPAAILANTSKQQTTGPNTAWFANKMLIWAALGLVILLLAYMSFQMVKDMKGKQ